MVDRGGVWATGPILAPDLHRLLSIPAAWLLALLCVCSVAVYDHHNLPSSSLWRAPGYAAAAKELATAAGPLRQPFVVLGLKRRLQPFFSSVTLAALAAHPSDLGLVAALVLPYLLLLLVGTRLLQRWLRATAPAQQQADSSSSGSSSSSTANHVQPSALAAAVSRAVDLFCGPAGAAAYLAVAKLLPAVCSMHTLVAYCLGLQLRSPSSQALQLMHPLSPLLAAALTLLSQAHPYQVLLVSVCHAALAAALSATYAGPQLPGYNTPLQAWLLLVLVDVFVPAGIMWYRRASSSSAPPSAAATTASAAAAAAQTVGAPDGSSSSSVQFQTPVKAQQHERDAVSASGVDQGPSGLRHRGSSKHAAEPASPAVALFAASPDVWHRTDQRACSPAHDSCSTVKQSSSSGSLQSAAAAASVLQPAAPPNDHSPHDSTAAAQPDGQRSPTSPRAAATAAIAAIAGKGSSTHSGRHRGPTSPSGSHGSPKHSTHVKQSGHQVSAVMDFEEALAACARGVAERQAAGLSPTALYHSTLHHHVISIKAPLHVALEGQELLQLVMHHLQTRQPDAPAKHRPDLLPVNPIEASATPTSAPALETRSSSTSPIAPTAAPMVLRPVAMRGCLHLLLPLCLPVVPEPPGSLEGASAAPGALSTLCTPDGGSSSSLRGSCVFDVPAAQQLLQGLPRAQLQQVLSAGSAAGSDESQRDDSLEQLMGPKGNSSNNSSRAFSSGGGSSSNTQGPSKHLLMQVDSSEPFPATAWLSGLADASSTETQQNSSSSSSSAGTTGSTQPPSSSSMGPDNTGSSAGCWLETACVLLPPKTSGSSSSGSSGPYMPAGASAAATSSSSKHAAPRPCVVLRGLPGAASSLVRVLLVQGTVVLDQLLPAALEDGQQGMLAQGDTGSGCVRMVLPDSGLVPGPAFVCVLAPPSSLAAAATTPAGISPAAAAYMGLQAATSDSSSSGSSVEEQSTSARMWACLPLLLVDSAEAEQQLQQLFSDMSSALPHNANSAAASAAPDHSTAQRVWLQHWQPLMWDWLFAVQGFEPSSVLSGCIPQLAAKFGGSASHPTSLLGSLYERATVWSPPAGSSTSGSSGSDGSNGSNDGSNGSRAAVSSRHAVIVQLLGLLVGREMWATVQQLRAAVASRQAEEDSRRQQHSTKGTSPSTEALVTASSGDAGALSPNASSRHDSCKSYQQLGGTSSYKPPSAALGAKPAATAAAAAPAPAVAAPGTGLSLRKQALQQQQAKYIHTLESPTEASRPPKPPLQAQQQQQQEGWNSPAGLVGMSPAGRSPAAAPLAAAAGAAGAAAVPASSAGVFTPHRRHSSDDLLLTQHPSAAAASATDLRPPRWSLDMRALQHHQQQLLMQPASFLAQAGILPMDDPLPAAALGGLTDPSPLSAGAAAAAAAGAAAAQVALLQLRPGGFSSPATSLQSASGLGSSAPRSAASRYSQASPMPYNPTLTRLQSHNNLGYSPSLPSAGSLATSVFLTAEGPSLGLTAAGPGLGAIAAGHSLGPTAAGHGLGSTAAGPSSLHTLPGVHGGLAGPAGRLPGIGGGMGVQPVVLQAPGALQQHQVPVSAAADDGGVEARHWAVFDTTGVEGFDQGADLDTAVTTLATNASRANSVTWLAVPTSQSGMGLHHSSMRTPRASRQSGSLFSSSTGKLRRSEHQHAFNSSLTPQPPRSRSLSHHAAAAAASLELLAGSSGSSSSMLAAAAAHRRQGARTSLFSPVCGSGNSAHGALSGPGHFTDAAASAGAPQDLLQSPPAAAGLGFGPPVAAGRPAAAAAAGVGKAAVQHAAGASSGPGLTALGSGLSTAGSRHTGAFTTPKRPGPPRVLTASPLRPLGPWSPAAPLNTLPTIGSEHSWDQNAHTDAAVQSAAGAGSSQLGPVGSMGTPPSRPTTAQQQQQQGLQTPLQRPLHAADNAAWVATLTPGPNRSQHQLPAVPRSVSGLPAGVIAATPRAAGLRGQQGLATPAYYSSRAGNLVSGSALAGAGAGGEGDTVSGVLQLLGGNDEGVTQSQGRLLGSFSSGSSLGTPEGGPSAAKHGNQGGYFTPVRPHRAPAGAVLPASARPASRPAAWGTPAVSGRNVYPGRSGSLAAVGASGSGFAGTATGGAGPHQHQVLDNPLLKAGRSIAGVLFAPAPPHSMQQQQRRILSTPSHIQSLLPQPGSASKLKPAAALLGPAAGIAGGKPPAGPGMFGNSSAMPAGIDQQQQQQTSAAAAAALLQLSPNAAAAGAAGVQVPVTPQAPEALYAGGASAAAMSSTSSCLTQPLFISPSGLLTEADMHTPVQSPIGARGPGSSPFFADAAASASGPMHKSSSSGALYESGPRAGQCSPPPAPLRPVPGVMLLPAEEAEDLFCSDDDFILEEGEYQGGFEEEGQDEEEGF